MRHGQLSICFPSLHQVPIDVTAGWAASPVGTRSPGTHFNSWVDWSSVSKVSCSRNNNNNTKVSQLGIEPGTFRLQGRCPNHLAMLPHTTHTHTCNGHANTHGHAYPVNQHWDTCVLHSGARSQHRQILLGQDCSNPQGAVPCPTVGT